MNNLVILRNDLKNKKPPRYKVIGITSELILSKKVFENNRNIIPFLDKVFDIEFREYVISSRMCFARPFYTILQRKSTHLCA